MTNPCISLDHANQMTDIAFVDTFADVAENSPWVAEYALGIRPFLNRDAMITAFSDGLFQAREDAQLEVIRAHRGFAASVGIVLEASETGQSGTGPGKLSPKDQNWFDDLVMKYEETFGFPFILALTDVGKDGIIQHFDERMANSRDEEFKMALARITEIFRIRIKSRICAGGNDANAAFENQAAPLDHRVLDREHSS